MSPAFMFSLSIFFLTLSSLLVASCCSVLFLYQSTKRAQMRYTKALHNKQQLAIVANYLDIMSLDEVILYIILQIQVKRTLHPTKM